MIAIFGCFFLCEVPNIFQSNTPALAAEVNDNFSTLATVINETESRVLVLENVVEDLELSRENQVENEDRIVAIEAGLNALRNSILILRLCLERI